MVPDDKTEGHWEAEKSVNKELQDNYECIYSESSSPGSTPIPTPKKPVFGVDETTNEPYYYYKSLLSFLNLVEW